MGFYVQFFGIGALYIDLEFIGPCKYKLGNTYVAFWLF
jgi:hypothetical protein